MKNVMIGIVVGVMVVIGGAYAKRLMDEYITSNTVISPIGQIFEKPLEKYTIDRLSTRVSPGSQIVLDEAIATTSAYTAYRFHYMSDGPTSPGEAGLRGAGKKVTGLAHIPHVASVTNKKPVIVQIRGYMEHDIFESGVGTRRSAEVFASNGFISLAPDFLGYGESDMPSEDVFEERFQTYTATLDLLASIPSVPMADRLPLPFWKLPVNRTPQRSGRR